MLKATPKSVAHISLCNIGILLNHIQQHEFLIKGALV